MLETFLHRYNRTVAQRPLFEFVANDPTVTTPYILYEGTNGAYTIKILTSGTLTYHRAASIDLFAVGGGGGAIWGGGGGGYTKTVKAQRVTAGSALTVTVGAGGAGRLCGSTAGTGGRGGTSSVTLDNTALISAPGGYGGQMGASGTARAGGNGGSGGGAGSYGTGYRGGVGGENAANGGTGTVSKGTSTPGKGQAAYQPPDTGTYDANTYSFGDTEIVFDEYKTELFSGGGGGGSDQESYGDRPGGAGGGGIGGYRKNGTDGEANTGGGGGGAGGASYTGGNGGSGVVIIRSAR